MSTKISPTVGKLLLLITTFLFMFLVIEAASRYKMYTKTPKGLVFDDILTFRCAPHSNVWGSPLNDNGDIGPDVRVPKQENEKRIFLLGGSTSHATSYVAAVQATLDQADPDGHYTVVSSGKPRYTSYNNVMNATRYLVEFQPDVFVVYLGVNDCIYNSFPWVGPKADVGYWDYASRKESIAYALFKYHIIAKRFLIQPDWAGTPIRSPKLLETHLRQLIAFAKERNIQIVLSQFVLSYPTEDNTLLRRIQSEEEMMQHFWGTIESTVYGVNEHNRVIETLAAEYDLPLVELNNTIIPADSEHFTDICHMTHKGRSIRGERIGKKVAELF